MIYFDILEPIRMLPDADKGKLLVAILEYGRDGIEPETDGPLGIVWSFVRPMIDKDGQRYEDMKLQREYAAFCKKRKKIWMPKISFDDWVCMTDNERQRAVDPVVSRNPTTTTSTTTISTDNNNLQLQPTTNNINLQHQQQPTTTSEPQGTPEEDFESLWQMYPAERRGDRVKAFDAFRMEITSHEDAVESMDNLKCWKQSEQWKKNGGQFIPYLCNWLLRGTWRVKPTKLAMPTGASGELGEAELEAIRRVLEQDMEE